MDRLYGKTCQGGLIFYIDEGSDMGLVAAPSDQSTDAECGCGFKGVSGAEGSVIGTRTQNTEDILIGCGKWEATRICAALAQAKQEKGICYE